MHYACFSTVCYETGFFNQINVNYKLVITIRTTGREMTGQSTVWSDWFNWFDCSTGGVSFSICWRRWSSWEPPRTPSCSTRRLPSAWMVVVVYREPNYYFNLCNQHKNTSFEVSYIHITNRPSTNLYSLNIQRRIWT